MNNLLQFNPKKSRDNQEDNDDSVTRLILDEKSISPQTVHYVNMSVGGKRYEKWNSVCQMRYDIGTNAPPHEPVCTIDAFLITLLPSPTQDDMDAIKEIERDTKNTKGKLTLAQKHVMKRICDLVYNNRATAQSPVTVLPVSAIMIEKIEFKDAADTQMNTMMMQGVFSYMKQFIANEMKCAYAGVYFDANKGHKKIKDVLDTINIVVNEEFKLLEYGGSNDSDLVIAEWEIIEDEKEKD